MSNYTKAINSNAYSYLRSLISKSVEIINVYVCGKWLTAELSSNMRFSVKNQDLD